MSKPTFDELARAYIVAKVACDLAHAEHEHMKQVRQDKSEIAGRVAGVFDNRNRGLAWSPRWPTLMVDRWGVIHTIDSAVAEVSAKYTPDAAKAIEEFVEIAVAEAEAERLADEARNARNAAEYALAQRLRSVKPKMPTCYIPPSMPGYALAFALGCVSALLPIADAESFESKRGRKPKGDAGEQADV